MLYCCVTIRLNCVHLFRRRNPIELCVCKRYAVCLPISFHFAFGIGNALRALERRTIDLSRSMHSIVVAASWYRIQPTVSQMSGNTRNEWFSSWQQMIMHLCISEKKDWCIQLSLQFLDTAYSWQYCRCPATLEKMMQFMTTDNHTFMHLGKGGFAGNPLKAMTSEKQIQRYIKNARLAFGRSHQLRY